MLQQERHETCQLMFPHQKEQLGTLHWEKAVRASRERKSPTTATFISFPGICESKKQRYRQDFRASSGSEGSISEHFFYAGGTQPYESEKR